MRHFTRYHLPAILYAVLIIILSSIPELGKLDLGRFKFDKIAHFFEYAIFALLIFRSFSHISDRLNVRYIVFLALIFVAAFAFFDEFYQSYVAHRHADPIDMIADISGATLIIIWLAIRHKKQVKTAAAG